KEMTEKSLFDEIATLFCVSTNRPWRTRLRRARVGSSPVRFRRTKPRRCPSLQHPDCCCPIASSAHPAGRLSGTNRPIAGASAAITPRIAAHGQETTHADGDFTGQDARLRHAAGDPALHATPTPRPRRATDRTTAWAFPAADRRADASVRQAVGAERRALRQLDIRFHTG